MITPSTTDDQRQAPVVEPSDSDSTPADPTPADSAPADPTPADSAPADPTPADSAPADPTPVNSAPADPAEPDTAPSEPPPTAAPTRSKPKRKPKPRGPSPQEVVRIIGDTNAKVLAYLSSPDPQLQRMSRKAREALVTELPPLTAGALLGPAALARHFIASAAGGRYRDLFALWEVFRFAPDECRPVLAERQRALERAREALRTAVRLGLSGHADRVAEDVRVAQGPGWQWLREELGADLAAVGARPAIAAALIAREPALDIPLPEEPDERWLAEAAAARDRQALPAAVDALLATHADRLPATVATLQMALASYPDRVPGLLKRVDLTAPDIGALLAWARDHGVVAALHERIQAQVHQAAAADRSNGLALWQQWQDRGVAVELPESLRVHSLDDLDLTKPETASLIAQLLADGAGLVPQELLDGLAQQNRQLAEKAYESFVCAGLDVRLPLTLEGNPIVKDGTRCAYCQAWTWVRPGHERRCPRRATVGVGAIDAAPTP